MFIYAPPLYFDRHSMALSQMHLSRLCSKGEGLLPSLPGTGRTCFLRLLASLTCLHALHSSLLHPASSNSQIPHPRGRLRQGSPWKPHGPSLSPPGSPSICSSPPIQLEPSPPPSPLVLQLHSLAIVPWTMDAPSRLCIASTMPVPDPMSVVDLPRSSYREPPPPCRPGNSDHQPSDSYNGVQLQDSLDIIYGLVFELFQGVEDLHFCLQSTDDKVTTLLQLLSSMRETFPSHPDGVTLEEMPRTETGEGNTKEKCAEEKGLEQTNCRTTKADLASRPLGDEMTDAEGAADKVTGEVIWATGLTYIEEEPWPGGLSATCLEYSLGF
jgi:hypothetical protein